MTSAQSPHLQKTGKTRKSDGRSRGFYAQIETWHARAFSEWILGKRRKTANIQASRPAGSSENRGLTPPYRVGRENCVLSTLQKWLLSQIKQITITAVIDRKSCKMRLYARLRRTRPGHLLIASKPWWEALINRGFCDFKRNSDLLEIVHLLETRKKSNAMQM